MIRCVVIDDEPLARELISGYVQQHPELVLLKSCEQAGESMEQLVSGEVDLLFLDIRMPGINGVVFLESLKNPPAVIFTTGYGEFAVKSYDLGIVDYLLKPVTFDRFSLAVKKFQRSTGILDAAPPYSFFKVNGELIRLLHAEIICIEAVKDYVLLRTTAKAYISHLTMKSLGEFLPAAEFARIHRSHIVNRQFVTRVGNEDLQAGPFNLPLGQTYKGAFLEWFRKNTP